MAQTKLPSYGGLRDGQFVSVNGPDGITTGFAYDANTRAFYFKESQVVYPSFHGITHIAEDPIPSATCDTPGLMSSVDKCRLDSLMQTRVGVLGFQGSGFPEDGGWINGDIILAAGSGFISLERFGNVVRFTVDSPVPLNCACESCNQIFWVQDETDASPAGVRPPVCSGKLPNINGYGELKVYQFPESTIVDPLSPVTALNKKESYPAFIFKRYTNSLTPNTASHELILKRDSASNSITEVGWAFYPPSTTLAKPQMVWYMGKDKDGNQIKFELNTETEPNLYGALLYKGNLLTKKMAVIVDYTSTILATNNYVLRLWDTKNNAPIGATFISTNSWQYNNPENPASGTNPRSKALDSTIDLLPFGTLVDVWSYQPSPTSDPVYFFSRKPTFNPNYAWNWIGQVQFGDSVVSRKEISPSSWSVGANLAKTVANSRNIERNEWGITGFDDPLASWGESISLGVTEGDITYQHRAVNDTDIPGLVVNSSTSAQANYSERPVYVWHRKNLNNAMLRIDVGRPDVDIYTPIDIIIRGNIDENSEKYARVVGTGIVHGLYYVAVAGLSFHDLPESGTLRILPSAANENKIFNYGRKMMFPREAEITGGSLTSGDLVGMQPDIVSYNNIVFLVAPKDDNFPYPGNAGDICELVQQEYNNTILRCEFVTDVNGIVYLQFKVGTLDMGRAYEDDNLGTSDDLVRGLAPGYVVSSVYKQSTTYSGLGSQPSTNISGFVVYEGGAVIGGTFSEYWNRLEIMVRDNQLWVWWNKLLIPPDANLSANLLTPVVISTPYYSIPYDTYNNFGKFGVRMFPGAKLRKIDIRSQMTLMSEFSYGQLDITV